VDRPRVVGGAPVHLRDALEPTSAAVRTLASVGLWVGWALGLAAAVVLHPVALTALRVLAPAGTAAAVAATVGDGTSVLAVGWAAVATALVFAPDAGMTWVNGPAYPNERRFPLRAPAPLLVGPVPLAWALAVAGVCAGPLLLAARQWILGAVSVAIGFPVGWLLLRSLHQLSRRWVVFVPAGFVLVDPLGLMDSILLRRQQVKALHPAPADSRALDLTQRAPGLALEVVLDGEIDVVQVRPGRRTGDSHKAARLLFTPTLPGAVLEEAKARRVG
jgi:hypothetical protein